MELKYLLSIIQYLHYIFVHDTHLYVLESPISSGKSCNQKRFYWIQLSLCISKMCQHSHDLSGGRRVGEKGDIKEKQGRKGEKGGREEREGEE